MGGQVIIVGAGMSGVCAGISLKKAGIQDFVILEKTSDLGGTWRDNTYPGCTTDVPVHTYSFSFAIGAHWTHRYGKQVDILSYIHKTALKHEVVDHIRYNVQVMRARYCDQATQWCVTDTHGREYRARWLILAVGVVHRPFVPIIPGLDRYAGEIFHSSAWRHDCDLTGRHVSVIGTGATAVQLIPSIASRPRCLDVYQRTASWILPRRNYSYGPVARRVIERGGLIARLYRVYLYVRAEVRQLAFRRMKWLMKIVEVRGLRLLRRQVRDAALRQRLVPSHSPGCKSLTLSGDYYSALARSNVELVTSAIVGMDEHHIHTADGSARRTDVIIFATGFKSIDALGEIEVVGVDERQLGDVWADGPHAYLGICLPDFPNMLLMFGPNTAIGHGSLTFMIECQARYITRLILLSQEPESSVRVSRMVEDTYNARLQRQLKRSVWATGCRSWYLDREGSNRVMWPSSTLTYWLRTRRVRRRDYVEGCLDAVSDSANRRCRSRWRNS